MENKNILLTGCFAYQGKIIAKFLQNKGFLVYGVGRYMPKDLSVSRFFKVDTRHEGSMQLVMGIASPSSVIFCHEPVVNIDYSYPAYSGLLFFIDDTRVKKLILCIDDIYETPKNPNEASQLALYWLTQVYKDTHNVDVLVVTKRNNLLKEIKRFLMGTGEGNGFIKQSQIGKEEEKSV